MCKNKSSSSWLIDSWSPKKILEQFCCCSSRLIFSYTRTGEMESELDLISLEVVAKEDKEVAGGSHAFLIKV
jgi:hypothetical protein